MAPEEYDINPYLQQEVLSASPIRLRWMLISQAVELCGAVEGFWKAGELTHGDQWLLRIRDILGELLAGVTSENPVSRQVSDFYLFLLKLLADAEQARNLEKLTTLKELLVLEAETWQMVHEKSIANTYRTVSATDSSAASNSIVPPLNSYDDSSITSSFSLEM
jgi:flagellin-specific chaperone FliS